MICGRCTRLLKADASFCDGCGADVRDRSRTRTKIKAAGGEFRGGIKPGGRSPRATSATQIGTGLVLTVPNGTDSSRRPTYQVTWSWRSSLTQSRLASACAILGVLTLLTGYAAFRSQINGPDHGTGVLGLALLMTFLVLVALLGIVIYLRGVVVHRTQHFGATGLLPVLTGWGGEIRLARFTGQCHCGGRLRFYNKPLGWIEDFNTGKRRVTERTMGAECRRSPRDHWWLVDSAEAGYSGAR